ncbi:prepilin-type N-terminal cleavage/methylation domain-containing protein [Zoogloea sp.]|uniref:type IV pilin protein n=1 Tax=Zoogloea sp. TaxID=49181 RepID=UPI001AC97B7A|nr:prepilin-type N-terminal cleavage/methylation domain-containing protein [Zoogloea sp.]MBN8284206.1 prepilin-type N-terminal cleavage/methylation domain-containing protein [Zoogloea sp.]
MSPPGVAPIALRIRLAGFTLIELLIVCTVLAALSAVAWGSYLGVGDKAQDELARTQLQTLAQALQRFRADTGYYPGQGPFVLSAAGVVESPNALDPARTDCSGVGVIGIPRSWSEAPPDDAQRDAWFASPLNMAMLYNAPPLCANHPLGHLYRYDADSRRGWNGPYLPGAARLWVDHGSDLNSRALVGGSGPDGQGQPTVGSKLLDLPAYGAGPSFGAAGPSYVDCGTQEDADVGNNCLLGWRSVRRETPGYVAADHELARHSRPFSAFGLADGDHPRVVYWGADGRYGGRNLASACEPNLSESNGYGRDDLVLCLQP